MTNINRLTAGPRTSLSCAAALVLLAAGSTSLAAQQHSSSFEEASAIAQRLIAQRTNPLVDALQEVERAQQSVELMEVSSEVGAPAAAMIGYAEAVGDLRRFPSPETLPALATAAQSEAAEVRIAAMSALRSGASSRDPQSAALLIARALITTDPSPAIRREAFEAYCRWGNQDDVLALSQALGRQSGPVQDLAVREWLRIEKERQ